MILFRLRNTSVDLKLLREVIFEIMKIKIIVRCVIPNRSSCISIGQHSYSAPRYSQLYYVVFLISSQITVMLLCSCSHLSPYL